MTGYRSGLHILLAAVAVLLCATVVGVSGLRAAEDHAAQSSHADGEHGESHGGSGPIEFKADLGVYTLVSFVILVVILSRIGWRPMLEAIQAREQQVAASVAEATKLKEQAEALLAEHRAKLAGAEAEIRAMMEEARRRAEQLQAELLAQARQEAEQLRRQAQEDIARARDEALQDLFERTAELVADVAARILPRHLSEQEHRQLVEEALQELGAQR